VNKTVANNCEIVIPKVEYLSITNCRVINDFNFMKR